MEQSKTVHYTFRKRKNNGGTEDFCFLSVKLGIPF